MRDHDLCIVLYIVMGFLLSLTLAVLVGNYLNAKACTDALKVCAASLSECDAYWEKTP